MTSPIAMDIGKCENCSVMSDYLRPMDYTEFEQIPGNREGQGSLACCSSWGHNESDKTELLKNNNKPLQID